MLSVANCVFIESLVARHLLKHIRCPFLNSRCVKHNIADIVVLSTALPITFPDNRLMDKWKLLQMHESGSIDDY